MKIGTCRQRATACRWLSVSKHVGEFRPKGQARGPLASPPPWWRRMCSGRQLQHGCTLALAKAREQHRLPVRKFQRIVMGHGVVHVDLPEARKPLPDLLVRKNTDAK